MVQIQAMSCGLPVICTVNSGGEEIINDNIDGFVLPIRDKIKLKDKILFLYNNRNICEEMGKNAKKIITDAFFVINVWTKSYFNISRFTE